MVQGMNPITITNCIEWLKTIQRLHTPKNPVEIWESELPMINRIIDYLQQLSDETDVSNEAHRKYIRGK